MYLHKPKKAKDTQISDQWILSRSDIFLSWEGSSIIGGYKCPKEIWQMVPISS
jgi:hypothetical protein